MGNLATTHNPTENTDNSITNIITNITDEFVDLENFMNCYLVNEGVRPAYLYTHHNLDKEQSRIVLTKLMTTCHKYFPELKMYLITSYGLFISKTEIDKSKFNNCNDVGVILGYPQDTVKLTEINRDVKNYVYNIKVIINNTPTSNVEVNIFSMVSQNSIMDKLIPIKNDIEKCLKNTSCPISQYLENVICEEEICYPPLYLVDKLVKNEPFTDNEYADMINYIWNIYNPHLSEYKFQLNNPIHRGILISLLVSYKYDVLEPLYGIDYGKSDLTKNIEVIRNQYSSEIIKQLDNSRIS